MFGFGKKLDAAQKKISGRTDLLEAFIAADVLVAAAEGGVDKNEEEAIFKKITSSKMLSGFAANDVRKVMDRMIDRIESGGRGAKRELKNEIVEAVNRDADIGEALVLDAMDIGDADGNGIGDGEGKVIDEIAALVGVKDWRQWV